MVFSMGLKFWGEYEDLLWGCILQCLCVCLLPPLLPLLEGRQGECQGQGAWLIHCCIPRKMGPQWCGVGPSHFSRLLDSPRRMWRHRSLSSSCPKPACQNPGAAHDLTGSGGKLRDNAEHLRTCGPGFLSACYRGSGALGHKNTQVLVLGRFKSLSGGIISLTVKRGSGFLD